MADPTDMILPMLREMRAENSRQFDDLASESEKRHAEVLARLDKLEAAQVSIRHALTADTLLSKLLTGEFEERSEALEKKVRELEGQS